MQIANMIQLPWMVSRDFNETRCLAEKIGGREDNTSGMHEFQEFIHAASLIDAGFVGCPYTWCNNRRGAAQIWQRLDRAFLSINFQDNFPILKILHLARVGSDHTPLCFSFQDTELHRKNRFIFERMWADHLGFLPVVTSAWSKQFTGTPGNRFVKKLKHLKRVLKEWNWNSFSNTKDILKELQTWVMILEMQLQNSWSDELHNEWDNSRKQLQQV